MEKGGFIYGTGREALLFVRRGMLIVPAKALRGKRVKSAKTNDSKVGEGITDIN
jgi:hypothetical protein